MDGATINWEVYKQFDGMNEEEITQMSVKDFEELEEQRMEKNAWHVAKTLVERIDGAPVLSKRIKAYLTENKQKQFLFNRSYLLQYHTASTPVAKNGVPGAVYFEKFMKFFSDHYKVGELFMEFVRTGAKMRVVIFVIRGAVLPRHEFLSQFLTVRGQCITWM